MIGESFSASGLIPGTNYSFRVAGVNSEGQGPFSDTILLFVTTDGTFVITSKRFMDFYSGLDGLYT